MARVFVDTSALLALLVSSDRSHLSAKKIFARLQGADAELVTSSYVLVETYALLGRRVGASAARDFRDGFEPLLSVQWIDETRHERALDEWLSAKQRRASLVDAASFVLMRELRIDSAFAFDPDFETAGFELAR